MKDHYFDDYHVYGVDPSDYPRELDTEYLDDYEEDYYEPSELDEWLDFDPDC